MKERIERVLDLFYQIAAIPHGSGNTDRIAEFCVSFAQKRGLPVWRDEANNVIVKKAATVGYEKEPPVLLQGHLDMVCQKEPDLVFDFENEDKPIINNFNNTDVVTGIFNEKFVIPIANNCKVVFPMITDKVVLYTCESNCQIKEKVYSNILNELL